MDEDGEKRVRTKRSCSPESFDKRSGDEVDWVSDLPDALLCHVLLNLPTKDVVKNSILSTKWRNLWRYVPGLELDGLDFADYNTFVSFVDKFLSFTMESCFNKLKLSFYCNLENEETDNAHVARWINAVIKRKIQHLDLAWGAVEIPPILYRSKSLVSLKLCCVILPNPEFVSLLSVKVMVLDLVKFANDLALEMLISGCLVLESLTLCRSHNDNVKVLRVSSQSLLSFTYYGPNTMGPENDELVVEIDAPKLEYLKLSHRLTASFIIKNLSSLVEAYIDIEFNFCFRKKFDPKNLPKREMIRNFLVGISGVQKMTIAACTLEVIYDYSRCEPLPLFRNLSSLSIDFYIHKWEILPLFLESCPNLKSLAVGSNTSRREGTSIISAPRCLLSSLEYVNIETPLRGEALEMKLVSYLLENSPILKKLTLSLDDYSRKKVECELLTIPRRSSSCQFIVL
ncbi:putative F-box/FBD/LRR-repeat protein At1g66300 [Arabidopsis lyrata subsp. lyrata]|uniref:putative F-box/FBD/LRR-repeat protein At1g66300 n=1 Tax=Arabidopsis lyrata subsp. lyrata TaxID=81972 RepID=UPI000A29C7D9|nr:putative F-box/FBD/LRR-repeat protein At1g66300 [Arabidopsis lyrata subsp. lyrata]XP_020891518.1 putative F-box/FBD/LRR-repeat protein At1g66300 [Arabidopsis lyrata subsp. lyrata]|eukprot:XP_020891517.1 putative F-box/FBD/LRR-repeat protein At1g66300 [Arabidopsis lyrata subsp. lyrata]